MADRRKKPTFNQVEDISRKTNVPFGYFFLDKPPVEECPILLLPNSFLLNSLTHGGVRGRGFIKIPSYSIDRTGYSPFTHYHIVDAAAISSEDILSYRTHG